MKFREFSFDGVFSCKSNQKTVYHTVANRLVRGFVLIDNNVNSNSVLSAYFLLQYHYNNNNNNNNNNNYNDNDNYDYNYHYYNYNNDHNDINDNNDNFNYNYNSNNTMTNLITYCIDRFNFG